MDRRFHITCPDCGGRITIDAESGEILYHKAPKHPPAGGRSFEDLMRDLDDEKVRAEQVFEQEKAAMRDRDRILEDRFREAMKRAEGLDDDEPPPGPFRGR